MITSRAPTAPAAARAPSMTRSGSWASSAASFALAGSPSVPLATTTARPRRSATADSLQGGREAPAAAPAQAAALDLVDEVAAREGRRRPAVAGPEKPWQAAGREAR